MLAQALIDPSGHIILSSINFKIAINIAKKKKRKEKKLANLD
jgi:hypothetical protein